MKTDESSRNPWNKPPPPHRRSRLEPLPNHGSGVSRIIAERRFWSRRNPPHRRLAAGREDWESGNRVTPKSQTGPQTNGAPEHCPACGNDGSSQPGDAGRRSVNLFARRLNVERPARVLPERNLPVTGPEAARGGTSGGNPPSNASDGASNGSDGHNSRHSMARVSHSPRRTSCSTDRTSHSMHCTRHSMDRSSRSMAFLRIFRAGASCSGKSGVHKLDTGGRVALRVGWSRSMGRACRSARATCVRQTSPRHGGFERSRRARSDAPHRFRVSLAPGFSPVAGGNEAERFQPLHPAEEKPLKRFNHWNAPFTGLKPGANERKRLWGGVCF